MERRGVPDAVGDAVEFCGQSERAFCGYVHEIRILSVDYCSGLVTVDGKTDFAVAWARDGCEHSRTDDLDVVSHLRQWLPDAGYGFDHPVDLWFPGVGYDGEFPYQAKITSIVPSSSSTAAVHDPVQHPQLMQEIPSTKVMPGMWVCPRITPFTAILFALAATR